MRDIIEGLIDGTILGPKKHDNKTYVVLKITGTGLSERKGETYLRPESEFLTPHFCESCRGLPVLLNHPYEIINGKLETKNIESNNFKEHSVGTISEAFIKGKNVMGVAQIYDEGVVAILPELSTSPSVTSQTIDLGDIKSEKFLSVDHIALVKKGTGHWDVPNEPSILIENYEVSDKAAMLNSYNDLAGQYQDKEETLEDAWYDNETPEIRAGIKDALKNHKQEFTTTARNMMSNNTSKGRNLLLGSVIGSTVIPIADKLLRDKLGLRDSEEGMTEESIVESQQDNAFAERRLAQINMQNKYTKLATGLGVGGAVVGSFIPTAVDYVANKMGVEQNKDISETHEDGLEGADFTRAYGNEVTKLERGILRKEFAKHAGKGVVGGILGSMAFQLADKLGNQKQDTKQSMQDSYQALSNAYRDEKEVIHGEDEVETQQDLDWEEVALGAGAALGGGALAAVGGVAAKHLMNRFGTNTSGVSSGAGVALDSDNPEELVETQQDGVKSAFHKGSGITGKVFTNTARVGSTLSGVIALDALLNNGQGKDAVSSSVGGK